jgi:hypothetical protein
LKHILPHFLKEIHIYFVKLFCIKCFLLTWSSNFNVSWSCSYMDDDYILECLFITWLETSGEHLSQCSKKLVTYCNTENYVHSKDDEKLFLFLSVFFIKFINHNWRSGQQAWTYIIQSIKLKDIMSQRILKLIIILWFDVKVCITQILVKMSVE